MAKRIANLYALTPDHDSERPIAESHPISKPIVAVNLSKAELDVEIEKGYADIAAGRISPAERAFEEINRSFDQ